MEITMAALLIGYFTAIAIVCLFLMIDNPTSSRALNIAEEG
jgi:hypothetical protein